MIPDRNDPASMAEALAQHPFAAGLGPDQVDSLADGAQPVEVSSGNLVIEEGKDADRAYLLIEGLIGLEVHVPERGAVVVGTVAPGELLGWSWILHPSTWHFDGRARTDSRLLAIDGAHLRRACDDDPRLDRLVSRQVIQTMARRLEAARYQLVDVYRNGSS